MSGESSQASASQKKILKPPNLIFKARHPVSCIPFHSFFTFYTLVSGFENDWVGMEVGARSWSAHGHRLNPNTF